MFHFDIRGKLSVIQCDKKLYFININLNFFLKIIEKLKNCDIAEMKN